MTDIAKIADAYIALWNETDETRRRDLLAANWAENASYADPLMSGRGHAEISALIGGVHQQFPGFRFQLLGKPDGHGTVGRFSWGLGPQGAEPLAEGTDFVEFGAFGLTRVTGFLDKVPAA